MVKHNNIIFISSDWVSLKLSLYKLNMDSGSKYESLEIEQEGREEGTDPKNQNDKGDLESMKPNHPRSIGVKMVAIFIYILGILSFTLMSVHWELIGFALI